MPLQISEINVQLAVAGGSQPPAPREGVDGPAPRAPELTPEQLDRIVERCIQGVLEYRRRDEDR